MIFKLQRRVISDNLRRLNDYESRIDQNFRLSAKNIPSDLALDSPNEAERAWAEGHLVEYTELTGFLPDILRQSSVVTLVSILESEYERISALLGGKLGLTEKVTDANGQGVVRSSDYLKRVCGIDLPRIDGLWQEVNNLIQIRNCIIHANGHVDRVKDNKREQERTRENT